MNEIAVTPLISHWCVKIDYRIYSLTTDNGSIDGKIKIELTDDDKYYDFYYYGN